MPTTSLLISSRTSRWSHQASKISTSSPASGVFSRAHFLDKHAVTQALRLAHLPGAAGQTDRQFAAGFAIQELLAVCSIVIHLG